MDCNQCGTRVSSSANFCINCGANLSPSIQDQQRDTSLSNAATRSEKFSTTQSVSVSQLCRRFIARQLDLYFCALPISLLLVFGLGMVLPESILDAFISLAKHPIGALIVLNFLSLLIESWLLSSTGSTLGKWLLGITVLDKDGGRLSFYRAMERTSNVLLKGTALNVPIISMLANVVAYFNIKKTGTASWDSDTSSIVTYKKMSIGHIVASIIVAVLVVMMLMALEAINRAVDQ